MKTRLLCFLMVLALLPCLALAEAAPQKLVVAEPVHLIGYLPLYVAIHEGYFADEGLDVTVVQATGGAHVTAVVSGDAFAVIGGVDSNNFANQGNADPIVAIVNCVNRANVYLFARAGLSPASDSDEDMADFLRGKIIIAGRYGGSPPLPMSPCPYCSIAVTVAASAFSSKVTSVSGSSPTRLTR